MDPDVHLGDHILIAGQRGFPVDLEDGRGLFIRTEYIVAIFETIYQEEIA